MLLLFEDAQVASTVRVKVIDFGEAVQFSGGDQWWHSGEKRTMVRDLRRLAGRPDVVRKTNEAFKQTCAPSAAS